MSAYISACPPRDQPRKGPIANRDRVARRFKNNRSAGFPHHRVAAASIAGLSPLSSFAPSTQVWLLSRCARIACERKPNKNSSPGRMAKRNRSVGLAAGSHPPSCGHARHDFRQQARPAIGSVHAIEVEDTTCRGTYTSSRKRSPSFAGEKDLLCPNIYFRSCRPRNRRPAQFFNLIFELQLFLFPAADLHVVHTRPGHLIFDTTLQKTMLLGKFCQMRIKCHRDPPLALQRIKL